MFSFSSGLNPKNYLATTLASFLLVAAIFIKFQNVEIANLESKLTQEKSNLALAAANNASLAAAIKNQNEKIELNKIDYEKKVKEFQVWKDKPAEIKYKETIKYKEMKSNECEDIKNIINSIRTTSF